ncbi:FKBP-type peptidyl-prolyl cis-trans isomerase [Spirochaeta lutea]|uniref:Peptidyl-prolyl cis-trans isomerase n=1 Tax=Spirochaeta lutea TaxID=1480694 RepID=A0A098R1V1_9SPIO|nr:peptidylprolyl isomerase [Spirochaeta lutea]KGE73959.1 hypothetical protein DC28_01945 [Spirochaeta lutea]
MKKVENNRVVTLDYELRDASDNTVLDSSAENGRLPYLHGSKFLMPGLEAALEGKSLGERVELTLSGDQAYGDYDEKMVFTIPRKEFPDHIEVEVGLEFEAEIQDELRYCTVTQAEHDLITVNANHPLAGRTLTVWAKITDIREASQEELEHGHVHEDGEDCDE